MLTSQPPLVLPAGFFPKGVVWATGYTGDPHLPLYPEEAAHQAQMGLGRRTEFALGRSLARAVLAQLSIQHFPLLIDTASGSAIWPQGVVGAITHSKGFALVAAAPVSLMNGLGVDMELLGRLRSILWSRILTPVDLAWLKTQPVPQQADLATLIFSAKEAFYKYQYPLTGRWLGLLDVSMRVNLKAATLHPFSDHYDLGNPIGRFHMTAERVLTVF